MYPYISPVCLVVLSPFAVLVATTQWFGHPRFRPWWSAVLSCVWLMICLPIVFLAGLGASAEAMNPRVMSADEIVLRIAGGWLFSGFALIWLPEALRRIAR